MVLKYMKNMKRNRFLIILCMLSLMIALSAGGCASADTADDTDSADSSDSASASNTETADPDEDTSADSYVYYSESEDSSTGTYAYTAEIFAMDTYMTVTAYGDNAKAAVEAAADEIIRLDELLSTGIETSEVAQINEAGGGELSEDTLYLVERALELYESTGGAYDITIYPVMALWGFTTGNYAVPDDESLAAALHLVNASELSVTDNGDGTGSITMAAGQEIDLGGIAKGYASGRVMEIFEENGVESAIISLGGNVHVLGNKPDGTQWKVGIQDPEDTSAIVAGMTVTGKAVITSGGYERYFEDEETGEIYHHIIDPETGYSAYNGLISVTIVSEDSTLADGLSTSLFVMGTQEALTYCEEHCASDGFDVVLVTEDGGMYVTDTLEEELFNIADDMQVSVIET